MSFQADRIKETRCPHCGHTLDVHGEKPLSTTTCPKCEGDVQVPAKVGTMLLMKLLGHGSSGVVYEGRDTVLSRSVAVKIIHKVEDGGDREKTLMSEARALAAVNHPNVLRIHNVGEHKGQSYIEMELLGGGNVRQMIESDKQLPEQRCLEIALDAARALDAAQRVGLTHRDVKPENILLDDAGTAKLVDFGVARFRKQATDKLVVGTPYYVAPEIVQQSKDVDFRADIYSLGCTLFHMLTRKPPFDAKSVTGVYMARLKNPPPQLRELDGSIHEQTAAVVDQMLQRKPDDRYASYDQLIADLEWALEAVKAPADAAPAASPEPPTPRTPPTPAKPRTPKRKSPARSKPAARKKPKKKSSFLPFVAVTIGMLMLLGLIIFLVIMITTGQPPE